MRAALLALAFLAAPAVAEENVASLLSQDYLQITSTFAGSQLTVFGAIQNPPEGGTNDIVVVVRGPETLMTVRRKDRVAGMWINNARAKLWLPAYYFIATTRPLATVSDRDTLGRYELGLANLKPEVMASDGEPAPYLGAVVRQQKGGGLYVQQDNGVEMQSATLFRVHVPIPAGVPRGSYDVEVYLFRDGNVVSAQSTPFYVDQAGFERRLFDFAHGWPLFYGVSTVLLAIFLGWGSTLFFRSRT